MPAEPLSGGEGTVDGVTIGGMRLSPRWLVVPASIALLALLGMATSSESRETFSDRVSQPSPELSPDRVPDGLDPDDFDFENFDPEDFDPDDFESIDPGERQPTPDGEGGGGSDDVGPSLTEVPLIEPDTRFQIETADGAVEVRVADDTVQLIPLDPDGALTGPGHVLGPDDRSPDIGYQVDDLGRLVPTPLDELDGESPAVVWSEDGIDIVRGDGSRVTVRSLSGAVPAQGADDLTVTEVDPDGGERSVPFEDERFIVDDDLSIDTSPPPLPRLPDSDDQSFVSPSDFEPETEPEIPWRWFAATVATIAVLSLALAEYLRRTAPVVEPWEDPTSPLRTVEVGAGGEPLNPFEAFLARLSVDPDPTRAIRLAFRVAERGMGALPARDASETPFEWHARVLSSRPDLDPALGQLCSAFATARFAPDLQSPEDRDGVVASLRALAGHAGYDPTMFVEPTGPGPKDDGYGLRIKWGEDRLVTNP